MRLACRCSFLVARTVYQTPTQNATHAIHVIKPFLSESINSCAFGLTKYSHPASVDHRPQVASGVWLLVTAFVAVACGAMRGHLRIRWCVKLVVISTPNYDPLLDTGLLTE